MMNFVCVLRQDPATKKHPGFYDKEWVNKLRNGVKRIYSKPFNFVCLSNVETDVETIPLESDFTNWWAKLEIFRPNLFTGPVTYLDLDIVLCNNFTNIFDSLDTTKFYMIKEPGNNPNSSIMHFQGDYSHLYTNAVKNKEFITAKYSKGKNLGDQGYISDNIKHEFLNGTENQSFQFKHHKIQTQISNPKFLIFISKHQKPSNNQNLQLVKDNWI